MLKVGSHDSVENEYGVWPTELPLDLVGMIMDSGHADVGVSGTIPWLTKFMQILT